jgi:hypothetical protein
MREIDAVNLLPYVMQHRAPLEWDRAQKGTSSEKSCGGNDAKKRLKGPCSRCGMRGVRRDGHCRALLFIRRERD